MASFLAKVQHGADVIAAPFKKRRDTVRRAENRPDLFALTNGPTLGFPQKPSALAYDTGLNLLAVATKTGVIRVYGKPGVQIEFELDTRTEIRKIAFLDSTRLVCYCSNNCVYLLEINFDGTDAAQLEEVSCIEIPQNEYKSSLLITDFCLMQLGNQQSIAVATECGKVFFINASKFALTDSTLEPDLLLNQLEEASRPRTLGQLEAIDARGRYLLLGFSQYIVVYDVSSKSVRAAYGIEQRLLSLSVSRTDAEISKQRLQAASEDQGSEMVELQFLSAHSDGSYRTWSFRVDTDAVAPVCIKRPSGPPNVPYGPYACKPITRVLRFAARQAVYTVFAGGLPRQFDNSTVSVVCDASDQHVAFDFTSHVIDVLLVAYDSRVDLNEKRAQSDSEREHESGDSDADADGDDNDPPTRNLALVVLCEEELVAIDLSSEDWPQLEAPYLHTLHSSAVSFAQQFSDLNDRLFTGLTRAADSSSPYADWFVSGGRPLSDVVAAASNSDLRRSLLVTGHENGTVSFWRADGVRFDQLFALSTAGLFEGEPAAEADADRDESDWPPLRRVGRYDPFADDTRLCVQRVALTADGHVLVAGAAGQCVVFTTDPQHVRAAATGGRPAVQIPVHISGVEWSGYTAMRVRQLESDVSDAEARPDAPSEEQFGFAAYAIVQLDPPGAIAALEAHFDATRMLIALGATFGFALVDVQSRRVLATYNTSSHLSADVMRHHGRSIARIKSLKQSLRQSFRRVRSRRSTRRGPAPAASAAAVAVSADAHARNGDKPQASAEIASSNINGRGQVQMRSKQVRVALQVPEDDDRGAVERCIEARTITNQQDVSSACVRAFHFAESAATRDSAGPNVCLFVGTNSGVVYVYTIPRSGDPDGDASLAKELRLQHGAPVLYLRVLSSEETASRTGHQTLLVCSEEQIKLFALPSLAPRAKVKLTATDGSRVRRALLTRFNNNNNSRDNDASPSYLTLVTNQGDVLVLGLPSLRLHFTAHCLRRDDIVGINSCYLSSLAVGVFQACPSELRCFTVAARMHDSVASRCTLDLVSKRPVRQRVIEVDHGSSKPTASTRLIDDGVSAGPVHVQPTAQVHSKDAGDESA